MFDADNPIALVIGAAAGSGWVFAVFTVLAVRRLKAQLRFAVKANHDLYIQLAAERASHVEQIACACEDVARPPCGSKHTKPKPGVN